jgi:hypothetical protein
MPKEIDLTIFDDSGLLSLVDCSAYISFLSENWDYEGIVAHFRDQMARRSILVWECGDGGGSYLVKLRDHITSEIGYREVIGCIEATTDRLHLVSYDALTMAAQFEDEDLPSKHEQELSIPVVPGQYIVRVVQMYDPSKVGVAHEGRPHFLVEVSRGQSESWSNVAWLSA